MVRVVAPAVPVARVALAVTMVLVLLGEALVARVELEIGLMDPVLQEVKAVTQEHQVQAAQVVQVVQTAVGQTVAAQHLRVVPELLRWAP